MLNNNLTMDIYSKIRKEFSLLSETDFCKKKKQGLVKCKNCESKLGCKVLKEVVNAITQTGQRRDWVKLSEEDKTKVVWSLVNDIINKNLEVVDLSEAALEIKELQNLFDKPAKE